MDLFEFQSITPVKIEWCQTFVMQLIQYWEQKECLYNTKSVLYRNKHARTEALEMIATQMQNVMPGVTQTDIKTKINYLRSQYGRELLKLQNATKSGAGTDDLYQPSSYWFERLSFLKDFVSVRKGKCNLSYAFEDTSSELETPPIKRKEAFEDTSPELENPPTFLKRKEVKGEMDYLSNDISTADDALKKCSDFLQKLSEPEHPEDDGTANFFRIQLGEITNKDLKDEAISKIMLLLFEYKKKNRDLAD